jgi:hypothetical protein
MRSLCEAAEFIITNMAPVQSRTLPQPYSSSGRVRGPCDKILTGMVHSVFQPDHSRSARPGLQETEAASGTKPPITHTQTYDPIKMHVYRYSKCGHIIWALIGCGLETPACASCPLHDACSRKRPRVNYSKNHFTRTQAPPSPQALTFLQCTRSLP